MLAKKQKIGIFDSGTGGVTILKGIEKKLPRYHYIYLADTLRAPYGNRSQKTIYNFTKEAVSFLFEQGCSLIILACNTASSEALRKIQQDFIPRYYPDKKILGVLIPAAEKAVTVTRNKKVGVIGTEATVNSKAFVRELKKINPHISVFQKSCPRLVPLIDGGKAHTLETKKILGHYLLPIIKRKVDTLILGCTHYSVLKDSICKMVSPSIQIISEEDTVPEKLKKYLKKHPEIKNSLALSKRTDFYVTGNPISFARVGKPIYKKKIQVKNISLKKQN